MYGKYKRENIVDKKSENEPVDFVEKKHPNVKRNIRGYRKLAPKWRKKGRQKLISYKRRTNDKNTNQRLSPKVKCSGTSTCILKQESGFGCWGDLPARHKYACSKRQLREDERKIKIKIQGPSL